MNPIRKSYSLLSPSFPLKNRCARFAWSIVYLFLFRMTPRPLHAWRAWLLRLFGAHLGAKCHIYPKAVIWAPSGMALKFTIPAL
jgi:putative colanic acid biosynthesis acetyltransferase WcaF